MTKNGFFKTLKLKAILCLTILCLLCSFAFTLSACGKDDEEKGSISYPSASKIEDDDALVKNGGFEYGAYNLTDSSFPVSSVTGWSIATDNNAQTSNVTGLNKGGVIDKNSWAKTLEKFYDSSSFKTILNDNYSGFEFTKENYAEKIGFNKEKVFADDNNRVLMLNAYSASLGGSAVKATSSNSITLDKGAYYEISVDVYTANLSYNNEEGANIRLINTINGTTQEVFGIYGIRNDAWTTYTMYVKADSELSCTITLVLGLGRGGDNANEIGTTVQGSAFFDNIEIKKLDTEPTENVDYNEKKAVVFGGKDSMMQKYESAKTYLYDMSVKVTNNTESFSDQKAGTISSESYKFISFALAKEDNSKPMFSEHDIYGATVYLLDNNKNETEIKKFTYNKDEDYTCKILVKNNFPTEINGTPTLTQGYEIKVVVGPTDGSTYLIQEANVDIDAIEIDFIEGKTNSEKITDSNPEVQKQLREKSETWYNLVSSIADKTVSLYAGYTQDYSEEKEDTYTINVAKYVDKDEIETAPVAPDGYKGITPDSIYLNNQADNPDKNFNTKIADGKAGLVNSAFNSYSNVTIPEAYEITNGNKNIQPLFINNNEESYGFIGETKTISASSYATVSLKVFVDSTAKAFIYIIDKDTMEPMVLKDKEGTEHTLVIELSNTNEWKTVNFYIATGNTAKEFRVELWNGSRDNATKSTGTVFFDDISISTSASKFESDRWEDLFYTGTLGSLTNENFEDKDKVLYTRELTDTEIKFNKEYPDKKVSYRQNYIWAKSELTVYAVFNTIDPVVNDPYENIEKEETTSSGCGDVDSSTFWFSFSSILLIVALVVALVALILKRIILRRKRNASDAKSHYKVTSRYNAKKSAKKETNVEKETIEEETSNEPETEDVQEQEVQEAPETENAQEEQKLDDYVYGEVQNFGEDLVTNEEKPDDDIPAVEEVTEVAKQPTEAEEVKEEVSEEKPE